LPRKKDEADPWWFSPTIFDVIPNAKVLRQFKYSLIQKIIYAFTKVQYPNRPRRAKHDWMEPPLEIDGAKFTLTCSIDENNKKIVIKDIRTPKKMIRSRRHR
jgi:hypothetical protein